MRSFLDVSGEMRERCQRILTYVPAFAWAGGQHIVQKAPPQEIERVGAANDELASPMHPIEHRLLLCRTQKLWIETVP